MNEQSSSRDARDVRLPDGREVPAIGLGTWRMGESRSARRLEVAAVRAALDMGYRLIDTAEMYGEGGAEDVVGEALDSAFRAGLDRDKVFIVSKVYPHNASRRGLAAACEHSLRRLGLERLDLYLLHWRGQYALRETIEGFESLVARGLIARWGVSNFDTADLHELVQAEAASASSGTCATNQVYYSLTQRGVEFDLLPAMRGLRLPLMAYCPIDQGALAAEPRLAAIAQAAGCTVVQLALAWLIRSGNVIAIPKSSNEPHLLENLTARSIALDDAVLAQLDRLFPPPHRKQPLAMT